ncbi:GDSL-type esterase/lipase family protein [Streptomyces sp. XM4193]|uniref:GDSL-type esterase/lipase family protein n=1 Tax=Streptomyces sp. XM4193 TaxID=2929782 RepID=UPI001FF9C982|nr:GDSL-type esterase/lipase family protein [Streptomyces sp. XM4193]MCK1795348.1 GDSL-type esterase/lipase family protein [Streptomyces sp. XM4193]
MRLMCVGDSMTIGGAGDFTWRYRLWSHLRRSGAAHVEFVGPRSELHEGSQEYADPAFPAAARAHLAGWGEGWLHLSEAVGDAVREHRPDTLLISLGLIDLGFYTGAERTAENARRFLAAARAARPDIRAVLLPVIPNTRADTDVLFAAECARFNGLLAELVAELTTARSPLVLTGRPPGYTLEHDTHDGTHPSESGEHRLAAAFADALHAAWSFGAPYAVPALPPLAQPAARAA